MSLKMKARQEVAWRRRASTAGRAKEKRGILDQFISTTGYSRWYAGGLSGTSTLIQESTRTALVKVSSKFPIDQIGKPDWTEVAGGMMEIERHRAA